jgi:transcriptional regulator with XRE-family HTH domain
LSVTADESTERFGAALTRALSERPEFLTRTGNVAWSRFAQVLADRAGISYASLHKAVSGEREPTMRLMQAVAGALGLEPDYFLEYRLARIREALDPRAQGGGDEGLRKAAEYLDRIVGGKKSIPR